MVRGERCGTSKLTEAQVTEIKASIGSVSYGRLAQKFGVSKRAISMIRDGSTWAHVPRPAGVGATREWRDAVNLTLSERLAEKAREEPSGCIIWTASGKSKYGRLYFNGRFQGAHRWAWIARFGEIPPGLGVLHKCDTPRCINTDHLFLGTHAENMRDMAEKGRARGKFSPRDGRNTKLSPAAVRDIRRRSADGCSPQSLAAEYGIHPSNIRRIVLRQSWAHVSDGV